MFDFDDECLDKHPPRNHPSMSEVLERLRAVDRAARTTPPEPWDIEKHIDDIFDIVNKGAK
jgi:hypothetical protein